MGISPMVTHEVGFHTDVTFNSSHPVPWISMMRADLKKGKRFKDAKSINITDHDPIITKEKTTYSTISPINAGNMLYNQLLKMKDETTNLKDVIELFRTREKKYKVSVNGESPYIDRPLICYKPSIREFFQSEPTYATQAAIHAYTGDYFLFIKFKAFKFSYRKESFGKLDEETEEMEEDELKMNKYSIEQLLHEEIEEEPIVYINLSGQNQSYKCKLVEEKEVEYPISWRSDSENTSECDVMKYEDEHTRSCKNHDIKESSEIQSNKLKAPSLTEESMKTTDSGTSVKEQRKLNILPYGQVDDTEADAHEEYVKHYACTDYLIKKTSSKNLTWLAKQIASHTADEILKISNDLQLIEENIIEIIKEAVILAINMTEIGSTAQIKEVIQETALHIAQKHDVEDDRKTEIAIKKYELIMGKKLQMMAEELSKRAKKENKEEVEGENKEEGEVRIEANIEDTEYFKCVEEMTDPLAKQRKLRVDEIDMVKEKKIGMIIQITKNPNRVEIRKFRHTKDEMENNVEALETVEKLTKGLIQSELEAEIGAQEPKQKIQIIRKESEVEAEKQEIDGTEQQRMLATEEMTQAEINETPPEEEESLKSVLDCVKINPVHQNNIKSTYKCMVVEKAHNRKTVKAPQDSLIAFPNDTARSLRKWPSNKMIRTIFTGVPRYSCPMDAKETYSPEEEMQRILNKQQQLTWMRKYGCYQRSFKKCHNDERPSLPEYQVSNEKLYQMLGLCPAKAAVTPKSSEKKTQFLSQIQVPSVLNPQHLYNVKATPQEVNFGEVAPNSFKSEKLNFHNLNSFPLKIHMMSCDDLSFPYGDSQTVKPKSQVDFIITYSSHTIGRHSSYVNYVINDTYAFQLPSSAEVVHKYLNIDKTSLVVRNAPHEEAFQYLSGFITLTNPLQAESNFRWRDEDNPHYSVVPIEGVIAPFSKQMCQVVLNSSPFSFTNAKILLTVDNRVVQTLTCSRHLRKYTVNFYQTSLHVNEISLNQLHIFHIYMANANYEDVTFMITNYPSVKGCSVFPDKGVICARSIMTLDLHIKISCVCKFNFSIQLLVMLSTKLNLQVTGTVVYPQVSISPDTIHERRVRAGSFKSQEIILKNLSTVNAYIQIPLEEYPEFSISVAPDRIISPYDPSGTFVLMPGKKHKLYMLFNPIDPAIYEFYLPIIINGILGPPITENSNTTKPEYYLHSLKPKQKDMEFLPVPRRLPLLHVDCTVAGNVVTFSTLHLEFKYYPGRRKCCKLEQKVRVTNELDATVLLCIRVDELVGEGAPFQLVYADGDEVQMEKSSLIICLKPYGFTVLKSRFQPKVPGDYEIHAPIFVKGHTENIVFNYMHFHGCYPAPCIKCNVQMVFFSPVPLLVVSDYTIQLEAYHYSVPTVIKAFIDEVQENDMKLSQTLSAEIENHGVVPGLHGLVTLSVHLSFCSESPISFGTTVNFCDQHGTSCSVYVVATADNCILTTHAFLNTESATLKLVPDHRNSMDNDSTSFTASNTTITEKQDNAEHDDKVTESSPTPQDFHGIETCQMDITQHPSIQKLLITKMIKQAPLLQYRVMDIEAMAEEYPNRHIEDPSALLLSSESDSSTSVEISNDRNFSPKVSKSQNTLNRTSFPYFPNEPESSYTHYMLKTSDAVQLWLYEQGFNCAYGMEIPTGITGSMSISPALYQPPNSTTEKRSIILTPKSILDVLSNLAGQSMLNFFEVQPIPNGTDERIIYLLQLYKQLLNVLKLHGACLAHVKPNYLLSYDDYVYYTRKEQSPESYHLKQHPSKELFEQKLLHNSEFLKTQYHKIIHQLHVDCPHCAPVMSELRYSCLNKQAWLDVLLQIAKTLALSKVTVFYLKEKNRSAVKRDINTEVLEESMYPLNGHIPSLETLLSLNPLDSNVYSTPERILLGWLNLHFKNQAGVVWSTNGRPSPEPRTVTNFHSDLADGLVLAAVTAAYCPYLIPYYLQDIYVHPETKDKACHNACCVISAWRAVHLAFTVNVMDIVDPNPVFMLLLCTTLHNNLPSLFPRGTIHFRTPLSCEMFRCVQIINTSNKRVCYKAEILCDPQHFFTVGNPTGSFTISLQEKIPVSVKFTAKKISCVTGILLLAGSFISPYYARNLTFCLQGEPSCLQESAHFNLKTPVYCPTSLILPITPPHPEKARYEILCSNIQPGGVKTFNATKWSEMRSKKIPRRLHLDSDYLEYNGEDMAVPLNVTVSCFIPVKYEYWLYFLHPTVGDFIVKVTTLTKPAEVARCLEAYYPPDWKDVECECIQPIENMDKVSKSCKLLSLIQLPCRHAILWSALTKVFQKTLDHKEVHFWNKCLETNIGLQLIQRLMKDDASLLTNEFSFLFNVECTYDVTLSGSPFIRFPDQITIADVRHDTYMWIPIHVDKNTPEELTIALTLTSTDGKEVRNYKIDFVQVEKEEQISIPHEEVEPVAFSLNEKLPVESASDSDPDDLPFGPKYPRF